MSKGIVIKEGELVPDLKVVESGLTEEEKALARQRVNSLAKCCEGGEEGWTG